MYFKGIKYTYLFICTYYMFKVVMEGLTGHIMFNDDGKRYNYTLHVVQMTIDSTITKVSICIIFEQLF